MFAARSKAQAKPQPRELVGTTGTIHEEDGLTLNHQNKILIRTISRRKSLIFFDTNRRYSEKKMELLNSARENFIFEIIIHKYIIGLMIDGKLVMVAGGRSKRRYQYCPDNLGTILYLRALQGHSGSNLIDPMLQDNVVIGTGIFPYIYHVGCTFNLAFYDQQWIGTWRSKFEQKTKRCSSCLLLQEMKVTETLNMLTSLYHVSRDTCTVHGKGIKTRYFGSILILRSKKD